jgi:imidazole glycerol phosphate synthase subunit HisF
MKNSMIRSILLGLTVAAVSLPLYAQTAAGANDGEEKTVAEVRTDGGVIMVSEGGAFQTAVPDQRVKSKARLMVSKESAATVVYDDGCEQKYDKPGIYEISATCALPVVLGGGSSNALLITGSILGGAALGALIENYYHDCPPVSR